jgi:hypothetical protein
VLLAGGSAVELVQNGAWVFASRVLVEATVGTTEYVAPVPESKVWQNDTWKGMKSRTINLYCYQ